MSYLDDHNELFELTQQLINFRSITPNDAGSHKFISEFLSKIGFEIFEINSSGTSNIYARYNNNQSPRILLAGHSDVVPPGDETLWSSDPFNSTIKDQKIWGRGACDMKGNLASMLMAAKTMLSNNSFNGSLHFLITSDEEGPATHGTQLVVEQWLKSGMSFDYTIVGEPSSSEVTGDVLRIGRRGSINAKLTLTTQQYHVAYAPEETCMTLLTKALSSLQTLQLSSHPNFPNSKLHVTHVKDDNLASNVIPSTSSIYFNVRFNPNDTFEHIQDKVNECLEGIKPHINIEWSISAKPFVSKPGNLITFLQKSILKESGIKPELNTGGGTSDARFLCKVSKEIVEFGCKNSTAHQIDEHIELEDLVKTFKIYLGVLENFKQ